MLKALLTTIKILLFAVRNPPKQDFINEMYVREQAQERMYRYGIGTGAKGLPPGKYFK